VRKEGENKIGKAQTVRLRRHLSLSRGRELGEEGRGRGQDVNLDRAGGREDLLASNLRTVFCGKEAGKHTEVQREIIGTKNGNKETTKGVRSNSRVTENGLRVARCRHRKGSQ